MIFPWDFLYFTIYFKIGFAVPVHTAKSAFPGIEIGSRYLKVTKSQNIVPSSESLCFDKSLNIHLRQNKTGKFRQIFQAFLEIMNFRNKSSNFRKCILFSRWHEIENTF